MIDEVRVKKEKIRRRLRARRDQVEQGEAEAASVAICDHLSRRWSAPRVSHLAGYAALGREIDVRLYLERSLKAGVSIYLPRVTGPGQMEFCEVRDFDELEPGAFGIDEPRGPSVDSEMIEIFLVPGLAFDTKGGRLGFGKGFYDRALPPSGEAKLVGVCYQWQLVEEVPVETHDRSMDAVVTEDGWVRWEADATSQQE